jgi:hypothetical protein
MFRLGGLYGGTVHLLRLSNCGLPSTFKAIALGKEVFGL